MNTDKIEKIFKAATSSSKIQEGLLLIQHGAGDFSFCKEYNRTADTPMLMASITKLFTTACILAMVQEGKLSLLDKIASYLSDEIINGLHIFKGKEYSHELTIASLLFQTSGLPDYYIKGDIFSKVKQADFPFTFEQELSWTKAMKPIFPPNTGKKAYYSDVNFDLLGKIIENKLDCSLQQAFETYIFEPLALTKTYLASTSDHFVPHTYYQGRPLERPLFIRSCFASGGAVTTARELMTFLKAFYNGMLFDKKSFSQPEKSNPLQMSYYPICYAGGYMAIAASMPFQKKVELVGHSGSTGSFAFYLPQKDLYIVGDLAQIDSPALAVRLAMKTALAL